MKDHSMPPLSDVLLDDLLIEQIKLGCDNGIESSYLKFERSIYYFPTHARVWFYLHQFDAVLDSIDLEGPFRIRRMSMFERMYFKEFKESFAGRSRADFIVETRPGKFKPYRAQDGSYRMPRTCPLQGWIQLLLNSLRLVRISSVGTKTLYYDIPTLTEGGRERFVELRAEYTPPAEFLPGIFGHHEKSVCSLDYEGVALLKRLVKHLSPLPDKMKDADFQTLLRALRRYNAALSSAGVEDEIVDLIIALETLSKTSGFKMVYNISYFIGVDDSDVKDVMGTLDKAYSIRSKIVHGGKIGKSDLAVISDIPRITRRALLLASVMGVSGKTIRKNVQDISFDAQEREKHRDQVKEWSPI